MIFIFNIFKKQNTQPDTTQEVKKESQLEKEMKKLYEIEKFILNIKNTQVFANLILMVSYYRNIVEYHKGDEKIVSVDELLLLKYIDMIDKILKDYDEENWNEEEINELINTLNTINDKLYKVIARNKEKDATDLKVDLKTINDLIKSDFN